MSAIDTAFSAISDSCLLYKEKWQKVVSAFVGILTVSIVLMVLSFVLEFGTNFLGNPQLSLISSVVRILLGFIGGLITLLIYTSVLKPLNEMANGKEISEWTLHFRFQIFNTLTIMVVRFLINLIILVPAFIGGLIFFLSFFGPVGVALFADLAKQLPFLVFSPILGLVIFIILLLVTVAVSTVVNLLLIFFDIELVVGEAGVANAIRNSYSLVSRNPIEVFLFSLFWVVLSVLAELFFLFLTCGSCCILYPLVVAAQFLVVIPVQYLSGVVLWNRLKSITATHKQSVAKIEPKSKPAKEAKTKRAR